VIKYAHITTLWRQAFLRCPYYLLLSIDDVMDRYTDYVVGLSLISDYFLSQLSLSNYGHSVISMQSTCQTFYLFSYFITDL